MSASANRRRAADTRKVYSYEVGLGYPSLSMGELRRLARRVWVEYGNRRRLPVIVAGSGVRYGGQWCSYCEGYSRIVLARHHRTAIILLHELTHALGPSTHGNRFQNLYAELLLRYACVGR